MIELKSCPFCLYGAKILPSKDQFYTLCMGCGVRTKYRLSEESAAADWNTRPRYNSMARAFDEFADLEKRVAKLEAALKGGAEA